MLVIFRIVCDSSYLERVVLNLFFFLLVFIGFLFVKIGIIFRCNMYVINLLKFIDFDKKKVILYIVFLELCFLDYFVGNIEIVIFFWMFIS